MFIVVVACTGWLLQLGIIPAIRSSIHSPILLDARIMLVVLWERRRSLVSMLADGSQSWRLELSVRSGGEGVGITFGYMETVHGWIWPADAWLVVVTDRAVGQVKQ